MRYVAEITLPNSKKIRREMDAVSVMQAEQKVKEVLQREKVMYKAVHIVGGYTR